MRAISPSEFAAALLRGVGADADKAAVMAELLVVVGTVAASPVAAGPVARLSLAGHCRGWNSP